MHLAVVAKFCFVFFVFFVVEKMSLASHVCMEQYWLISAQHFGLKPVWLYGLTGVTRVFPVPLNHKASHCMCVDFYKRAHIFC